MAVAAFILLFMKDSPEAAGFHPIEQAQGKKGGLKLQACRDGQIPAVDSRLKSGRARPSGSS